MQKLKLLFIFIPFLSSFSFAAEDVSGHRVGAGYNKVKDVTYSDYSYTRGTGIQLEYGYDINKVFGLNVAFATHNENAAGLDLDGFSFKLNSDIGYTFVFDSFSIKPYGAIGLINLHEEYSYGSLDYSGSESSLTLGIGTRAVINKHFYADIRYDITALEHVDLDILSFTVGYKF
ncbi:MAG: porin family protein [Psychromonas sp.]